MALASANGAAAVACLSYFLTIAIIVRIMDVQRAQLIVAQRAERKADFTMRGIQWLVRREQQRSSE